jgi:glycerol-3-phosphate dehydrogenase
VAASFAGLRPLAYSDHAHASSVSREDKIALESGILTILGGKLTTYRSMAQKALVLVLKGLGRSGTPPPHTRLPGAPLEAWDDFMLRALKEWPSTYGITEAQARQMANLYGGRALSVLEPIKRDPRLREPLVADRPELSAQVLYAAHREDARHLSDVLLRRLEIGYVPGGEKAAEPASRLMAESLGWSEETRLAEVARYLEQRGSFQDNRNP